MATDGWVSLTSIDRTEIVITTVTAEEHQTGDGLIRCESRINSDMARSDLRLVWVERAGNRGDLYYRDIYTPKGDAELVSKMSVEEFQRSGGKMIHYGVA